jgi:predicted HicB family RNase H-like nuclease
MYRADEYSYNVFKDDESDVFVSTATEFPSLSNIADTQIDALTGMVKLVNVILKDMQASGEDPPEPLNKRKFSGKISLRMTPEQHRRIATEAAEQGVSINQLLVSRI